MLCSLSIRWLWSWLIVMCIDRSILSPFVQTIWSVENSCLSRGRYYSNQMCKHQTRPAALNCVLFPLIKTHTRPRSASVGPADGVSAPQVLLAVVVLSWSYVIYASRIASHWLLEKRTALLQQDWLPIGPSAQVRGARARREFQISKKHPFVLFSLSMNLLIIFLVNRLLFKI